MTLALFEELFHKTFVPKVRKFFVKKIVFNVKFLLKQVKEFLRSKNLPQKTLLLMHNAPCHPKDGELTSHDGQISMMCFPQNRTALIQPMDQNVIRLTKLSYNKSHLSHIVGRGQTIDESLLNINLKDAICYLTSAWNALKETSIRTSFQKLFEKPSEWDNEYIIPPSELRLQLVDDASNFQNFASGNRTIAANDSF